MNESALHCDCKEFGGLELLVILTGSHSRDRNLQVGKVGKRSAPPLQRSAISFARRAGQDMNILMELTKMNSNVATLERGRASLAHLPNLRICEA